MTFDQAKALKEAGLQNYHHNLETARSFFPQICTTHDYEEDVQTVKNIKAAGLSACRLLAANSLMIGNYLTTAGRNPELDKEMIEDLGLDPKFA